MRGLLRANEFDVAVVKTSHDWRTLARDIPVVLVIRRRCRPVVLQFHGSRASWLIEPDHRLFKLITRILLALVDGIMVLSTEEQRELQAYQRRTPVWTVKNPYVRVLSSEALEPIDPMPVATRVLFVGRLIEEKGIFDVVEALPHVLEQLNCQLVVVGEGAQESRLRQRIRGLGLEDHVTLTGYLAGADLIDQYRSATIFVLPTSWKEGFPTVLAEAMDAGLPIITTRIRGAADHLVSGENALFVAQGDVTGLAAAMTTLLRNKGLRARMRSANRERVRIFEPEVVAAEFLRVLQSLRQSRITRE
jgi:glycosyltransferase involved in cell wall biosynthesis